MKKMFALLSAILISGALFAEGGGMFKWFEGDPSAEKKPSYRAGEMAPAAGSLQERMYTINVNPELVRKLEMIKREIESQPALLDKLLRMGEDFRRDNPDLADEIDALKEELREAAAGLDKAQKAEEHLNNFVQGLHVQVKKMGNP